MPLRSANPAAYHRSAERHQCQPTHEKPRHQPMSFPSGNHITLYPLGAQSNLEKYVGGLKGLYRRDSVLHRMALRDVRRSNRGSHMCIGHDRRWP
jgi:hypothetical protein